MTEEIIKVRVQEMFPNCLKYKLAYGACCDKTWKKELENVKNIPDIKLYPITLPNTKKPEDFEKW